MKSVTDGRPIGRRSLSRTLWRRLASLPSSEQIERLIAREVARAERNGLHFSLVLFRVKKGGRLGLAEKRLALTLLRRSRLTDEVGWYDDNHLCALLPDTSALGAQIFADAVVDLVARKGQRPIATVYSFPFDWPGNDDSDSTVLPRANNQTNRSGRASSSREGFSDSVDEDDFPGSGGRGSRSIDGGRLLGDGPRGPFNRVTDGGVAVMPAPVLATADRLATAPRLTVDDHPPETVHRHPVMPVQQLLTRRMPIWKRAIDLCGALLVVSLASPFMIFAALAIRLTSKGPIIFKQRRAGLGGQPFTIYKFRTMCVDAEARKQALRKQSEQDGPAFKMARDPRVTRIGSLLRKTSLDELPQLFNVIKGDMSLVGPRPLPIDEQNAAETWQQRRLDVTPGLTCIWQVEGRSRVTFAEWVRMDVAYMRRRTIFHDLSILMRTVPAVLLRRGAR